MLSPQKICQSSARSYFLIGGTNSASAASAIMPQSSANAPKIPVVVLAVEDEEVIRILATEFMAETGFDVLEAPDADTAVRLLQTEAATRSCPLYRHYECREQWTA